MDIKNNLILLKGKDVTTEIDSCAFQQSKNKWHITYEGSNKIYTPNRENLKWYHNPVQISPDNVALYLSNDLITGLNGIIDFGPYVRLLFNDGSPALYHKNEIRVATPLPSSQSAQDTFRYFKELSSVVSLKDENDDSFLGREYEKMLPIHHASVLYAYLAKESHKIRTSNNNNLIYPFGFNLSQKSAVKKAFSSSVSIIEGPPGTGKTQTILNIIANAVMNNKTVAVVSNNNYATLNVYEKLEKYNLSFLCAYLGRSDNRKRFFNETQHYPFPEMDAWVNCNAAQLKSDLSGSHQNLDNMLSDQNTLALLKQLLDALKVEKHYFDQYYIETVDQTVVPKDFRLKRADHYLAILFEYQRLKASDHSIGLFRKFYLLFVYGMRNFSFYDMPSEQVISYLQKRYYEEKTSELEQEIRALSAKLEHYHFDKEMKSYSNRSMEAFKAVLAERYAIRKKESFSNRDFQRRFNQFTKQYPVVLSTTHSLRNCAQNGYLFDYVIVDEASQVDLISGGIALSCAKNVVIVGDLKQLPNIVERNHVDIVNQISDKHHIDEAFHYASNSLLSSIHKVFSNAPQTLLREHYRCHPKIIGFCNHKFYRGELVTLTPPMDVEKPLMAYKTVKGNHARGRYNQRQIDVVFEEVIPEQCLIEKGKSVAIISPYRPQANSLAKEIKSRGYEGIIEANTVHKFQGMEKDVVIFTTVANEINDFIDNSNLINVAVSRAIEQMIIVAADYDHEGNLTNIGDLIKYIDYNNFDVINSKIYSVFDLLYKQYSEELLKFLRSGNKISKYNSENLMETVIQKVLNEPEFQGLDRVIHQPLRMLIREPDLLNKEEQRYALHPWTHTDFLIFNRIDKSPVLVVEVDGYAFHANNPKQLMRDKMKDDIFQKYNIPIIRFGTNENHEEQRLKERLHGILAGS